MKLTQVIVVLAIIALVAGCAAKEEQIPEKQIQQNTETGSQLSGDIVLLEENGFVPDAIKAAKGSTITWKNKNSDVEKLRIFSNNNEQIKSEELEAEQFYSYTFVESGEFAIQDSIGHEMVVSVE